MIVRTLSNISRDYTSDGALCIEGTMYRRDRSGAHKHQSVALRIPVYVVRSIIRREADRLKGVVQNAAAELQSLSTAARGS